MTGKPKKINIALVGAGGIGKRYGNALKKSAFFTLVAVVDTDTLRAESIAKEFKNCEILVDWKELSKRKDIDAVIVATPHKFLAPITTTLLKSGKHVLSEKPGGVSSEEVKRAIQVAKKKHVRYMIGFNHRFHECFLRAQKLVSENAIGKIQFIRSVYAFGGRPGFEHEWRHNPLISGGGELIDQGIHMIDMVRLFFGDVTSATGFIGSLYWNTKVEDNAFVVLKNKKKQIASIHVSWSNWKAIHRFEIYGSAGYIHIEGLGRKYGGTEKVFVGKRNLKTGEITEKEYVCNPDPDMSLVRELEEFGKAIQENRDSIPNGSDAYRALKIVEKIYS